MTYESWQLVKQMEELAVRSLPPELYEKWHDEIYAHYSERVFMQGFGGDIKEGEL
jgi:hypothetical protein